MFRYLFYSEANKFVREIRILEAEFANPPASAVFQIEFERPLRVRDQVKQVDYPPSKVASLANMPSGQAKKWRQVSTDSPAPPMAGERPTRSFGILYSLVAGCVFLIAAYWVYRRRV